MSLAPKSGVYRTIPVGHRLHAPFLTILMAFDTLTTALAVRFVPNFQMADNLYCQFPLPDRKTFIGIDTRPIADAILTSGEIPPLVFFHVDPEEVQQLARATEGFGREKYYSFSDSVTNGMYLEMFETHAPWLGANVNSDSNQQPELVRFARMVRNAIGHHGIISWDNPNPAIPPVKWYNFEISRLDNGRRFIGTEFHMYHSIALMIEFSDELDRLGCPHTLP